MQFARIPALASVAAWVRVNWITAAFAAPYAGVRGEGLSPEPEEMLMMFAPRAPERNGSADAAANTAAAAGDHHALAGEIDDHRCLLRC